MHFQSVEQSCVVKSKINSGYEVFGFTKSTLNGLDCVVLNKGNHLVVINSLGYDEHYKGKTWRIYE